MKHIASITFFLILVFSFSFFFNSCKTNQRKPVKEKKEKTGYKYDDIEAGQAYEMNMLKNPITGKIPEGIKEAELKQANDILDRQMAVNTPALLNSYIFEGPNNRGGRTRSVVYDVRFNGITNQVILAGGVSSGVFKSTDNGATWVRKSPLGQLFSVTSIAQDPRPGFQDTWYYATGEAVGNSAAGTGAVYAGNGVYKSVDNGETWTRLAASNATPLETFSSPADFISKVVVDPATGNIYIASCAYILRSVNGGTNWQVVLSGTFANSGQFTDVVVTSSGRLYAAFGGTNGAGSDGVWTSTSGSFGTWTNIATAGTPAGWNNNGTYGRVVLAVAPSDENLLYALYWNNVTSNCTTPAAEAELFLWNQSTAIWTDRSANLPDEAGCLPGNDPFAVQKGYCLTIAVKPDDANVVFIGGTNLYRSSNGFSSTAATTRIGGYANAVNYSLYSNSHPDIHAVAFQPGSPAIMLCGNDGGIQRTSNNLAASVIWSQINNGYRTYQFYYVTPDPQTGSTKVMGGAQDNGTARNIGGSGSAFEEIFGGDGGSVGLAKSIAGMKWEYLSTQGGKIYTKADTDPNGFVFNITPVTASTTGLFVTLFYLDPDNTENLYFADNNSLYRTTSASVVDGTTWTRLTGFEAAVGGANDITAIATARGAYNTATSSLFAGTGNGKVFRLDNPVNAAAAAVPADITGASFPAGAYVSSIAVNPRNDDTVLVTFSNYGVTSVFWTGNANAATPVWQNVEGNLTLPSFRSAAIVVNNNGVEYYTGTSVGLFSAVINGTSPATTSWVQEGAGSIGNAPVTCLALRTSDNKLVAGTHGYGMWSSLVQPVLPVSLLSFKGTVVEDAVALNWSTSVEINSREFWVEKSADGNTFKKIGVVPAAGNSSLVHQYSFTDGFAAKVNYYRLVMVDRDGKTKQSNTLVIKKSEIFSGINILNNPFENYIGIRFAKKPGNHLLLELTGLSGRKIASKQLKQTSSSTLRLDVPAKNLPSGVYILTVTADGEKRSYKVLKQ